MAVCVQRVCSQALCLLTAGHVRGCLCTAGLFSGSLSVNTRSGFGSSMAQSSHNLTLNKKVKEMAQQVAYRNPHYFD